MHEKAIDVFGKMVEEFIKYPDLAPDRLVVISLSDEEKNRVLTPERLKLIRIIKNKKPEGVSELAKLVDRRMDAVSRDLKILKFYGFLDFVKTGKKKIPKIEKDVLIIPLTA